jgi:hypothetical protein
MDEDKVTRAFGVISEEIRALIEELNDEGARAFRHSKYEIVDRLRKMGEELAVFHGNVEQLETQWVNKFGADNDNSAQPEPEREQQPFTLPEETVGNNGTGLLDRLEQFK